MKISVAAVTAIFATCFAMVARAPVAEAHTANPTTTVIPASIAGYDFTLTIKEGNRNPYRLEWANPVPTKLRFNRDGQIATLNVGLEEYRVRHHVKRTDSGLRESYSSRKLAGDEAPNEDVEQERLHDIGDEKHRGLTDTSADYYTYRCDKCHEAATFLTYVGIPSVCDLKDESHVFAYEAMQMVEFACDDLEIALQGQSYHDVLCADECYHHV